MREIISEILRVIEQSLPCVLCQVIATRGSTPQKAGAAMLVFADGRQVGTLGGGCVEAEVKKAALMTLSNSTNNPTISNFTLDDDYGWDDGLICGGRMTIMTDALTQSAANYYRQLSRLIANGAGHVEAVAMEKNHFGMTPGSRSLFDQSKKLIASLAGPSEQPSQADGFAMLRTAPRITLFIVGGGHVGKAVAKLAAEVDFKVWVLDDRDSFVTTERFPNAERRLVGDIGRTLQSMKSEITSSVYALIVTRGHNHDEEALYHLASTPAGYVGMIGSRRKVRLIFEDLRAKGISDEVLSRVRAPVGLDIGSQTVPEIAVSIVAELIARRSQVSLKD